jgi:hypothetical protein
MTAIAVPRQDGPVKAGSLATESGARRRCREIHCDESGDQTEGVDRSQGRDRATGHRDWDRCEDLSRGPRTGGDDLGQCRRFRGRQRSVHGGVEASGNQGIVARARGHACSCYRRAARLRCTRNATYGARVDSPVRPIPLTRSGRFLYWATFGRLPRVFDKKGETLETCNCGSWRLSTLKRTAMKRDPAAIRTTRIHCLPCWMSDVRSQLEDGERDRSKSVGSWGGRSAGSA